jgi:hypothetical protein
VRARNAIDPPGDNLTTIRWPAGHLAKKWLRYSHFNLANQLATGHLAPG